MLRASSASRHCSSAARGTPYGTPSSDSNISLICYLSPPHLFLLSGLFFLITGPVRSGLGRADAKNLLEQLPMLVTLGLAFEILQFVTQYGFYPEALMRDHPLSQIEFHSEQFVLSVFLFYRQALEMAIVIWQSLLLAAAILYLCARKRLHFGALIIICVVVKLWIGGELSTDLREFLLVVLASISAGAIGDFLVAKLRPSLRNPNVFRLLGFIVPSAYFWSILCSCRSSIRGNLVG